jgi:radical SAM superfamily enzyme YgiQ (UPF0313 family)
MPTMRRSISEIMYHDDELDVALLQPPLFKPIFPEEQDPVFNHYLGVVTGHTALMNDLGTEPNHGLLQLAAILQRAGARTDVFDFHVLDIMLRQQRKIISEDDYREVIARKSARLWGISSKVVSSSRAMRIAEIIKEVHPGSRVVMGGVHPTFQAAQVLRQCPAVDAVMRGESDHAIVPLWRWAAGDGDLASIPGVTFRAPDGGIASSEKDLAAIDLDELPYAAYELVARETDPLVPRILTARGCTLRCVFCSSAALFGYKFNSRQATAVVNQIEATRDQFGTEFVCMGDLTFMAHKPTGLAICRELISRGTGVRWSTQTTIGRIDAEAAGLMANSGCVQIGFGVESGSQLIIEANNKNVHVEKAEQQFALIKEAGMTVQTYWVFGLPGETVASALRSVELMRDWIARELIDAVHITMAVPYPGTPLGENPAAYGIRIIDRNFDNYWTSSASLGIGLPVIESRDLTREHIYMFWQLAHATAADEFAKRVARLNGGSFHYIPRQSATGDAPLADVLMPDPALLGRPFDLAPDERLSQRTLVEIKRSRDHLRQGDACQ